MCLRFVGRSLGTIRIHEEAVKSYKYVKKTHVDKIKSKNNKLENLCGTVVDLKHIIIVLCLLSMGWGIWLFWGS